MKNRVLITSVGRKVSLVRSFKEAGWHVTGQDINPNAVALKFCDEVAQSDLEQGPFDMILPTRDAELKIGTHRPSDETIDICLDKLRFSDWCLEHGFMAPKTLYTYHSKDRGVIGAAFVKPRFSSSENKEKGFVECVYQENVEGEEYSVDLFADFDGRVISSVPRTRAKVLNGESCVTITVTAPILVEESVQLSKRLGLIGHNVLQAIIVNSVPYWTDINCRFGGASIVGIKAGCKSPEWLLRLINGEEVKPCLGNYKVSFLGRSYSDWVFDGD